MNRVLTAAAVADLLLFGAASVLGVLVDGEHLYREHFALALFTSILSLLIHVVVFTYFSATGRMVSQAVWIGHLDRWPLDQIRRHKARVMRWVALAVATIVLVVSLGALSAGDPRWRMWHLAAAALAIAVNARAFHVEHGCIERNRAMVADVFAAYNAARDTGSNGGRDDAPHPGPPGFGAEGPSGKGLSM